MEFRGRHILSNNAQMTDFGGSENIYRLRFLSVTNPYVPALKTLPDPSPGQRSGFRNPSIVVRPEWAQHPPRRWRDTGGPSYAVIQAWTLTDAAGNNSRHDANKRRIQNRTPTRTLARRVSFCPLRIPSRNLLLAWWAAIYPRSARRNSSPPHQSLFFR